MGVKPTKANQPVRVAGFFPEVESLRQWRQRWHAEIERRAGEDFKYLEPHAWLVPTSIVESFEYWKKREQAFREVGPAPTVYHHAVLLVADDGSLTATWRMPLMVPSYDLTWLVPGRLESWVSDAAHALVERQRAAEVDAVWGRALFRARLLGYGFDAADVERALVAARDGAHVQLDTTRLESTRRGGRRLLVDGVEMAADMNLRAERWLEAALADA